MPSFRFAVVLGISLALVSLGSAPASAQSKGAASAAASAKPKAPAAYDDFVKGATVKPGLIPIIEKEGTTYLAIGKDQLDKDFIESSVPSTGLGGFGPAPGEPYVAPARIFRFVRHDQNVAMVWPNTAFYAQPGTAQAESIAQSFPDSIVGVTPIVAQGDNGVVVVSAADFLGDVADFSAIFGGMIESPLHGYHLDATRSFFTSTKALPANDVLRVTQTWSSEDPNLIDNTPDARSLAVGITYNIANVPSDGYMPRLSDSRVGYFEQPYLDFSSDTNRTRHLYYLSRWNFAPQTPGTPSPATHPLVFTLSSTIPPVYRDAVRSALLAWNEPLAEVGILNAVQVVDQPTDGSFDPDDIRNNVVRWFDSSAAQYGAEALIETNPLTGEEINAGINVDSVVGTGGLQYRYLVAPARHLPDSPAIEAKFEQDFIKMLVLHESGHDLGFQHNFISSLAYSAKDLQNPAFTQKYGVASSVMEYAPLNLWPAGTGQGDYWQLAVGPYDKYALRYGYGYVPGATTPAAELPTLNGWASDWANPMHRFASDEDAFFDGGRAVDPRVQQDDLTDDPLTWETVQLAMLHGVLDTVDQRFPGRGQPYEYARYAFMMPLRFYVEDATMAAHDIGGEHLSRANAGDPHATVPFTPVPRDEELRAWGILDRYLFADTAWRFKPSVLQQLPYAEHSVLSGAATWAYDPPARHDVSIVSIAAAAQDRALDEVFAPLTLRRIDELSTKYARGATMSLADVFDWSRRSIFGSIASGREAQADIVTRSLQLRFARRLAGMWLAPKAGTPADAQTLARLQLVDLRGSIAHALRSPGTDEQSVAQLQALDTIAREALDAHAMMAATSARPGDMSAGEPSRSPQDELDRIFAPYPAGLRR